MATYANGNGVAHDSSMAAIFPEALQPLAEADPEVFGLVQAEKQRQW